MDRDHPGYSMNDAKLQEHRISVSRCCPSCGHELDCMPRDMVGLPVGVKFDPTDQELIEHLETKVMDGGSRAHPLIEDFIPTIQGEDGICYTHPEKLPGVTRNGQSKHFFHRSPKAYTTGTRKRRKIQAQGGQPNSKNSAKETRWHKTGKTRPLMVDGRQKGCKKILVLYTSFGKHRKPEKTNWVMHQYHLGGLDDEKEGELIVSKVFYQTQTRHGVAGTAATLDECARDGNMEAETAGSTQIGSIEAYAIAAAAAAAVEGQRQQLKQDDEQFSYAAVPKKRLHELQVGADHEVAVDQAEEQYRHHHRPSQHHVSPNLQEMSLPGTNALATASQPQSLISAIHPASVNLNNKVPNSTMLLANGNFQRPPARQCKETQWRYKTSQPDNRDQHG